MTNTVSQSMVLNEEQKLLKDSAREFFKEKSPVSALRTLRDNNDKLGFDQGVWYEMVQMGWTALTLPEAYNGLDFGYVGMGQILEEGGRTLAASPLFSTMCLGAQTILLAGSEAQKKALLPGIADGDVRLSLALGEGKHHMPTHIETTAKASGDGYVLNGSKTYVIDGHIAQQLIVVARTSGDAQDEAGISLFLVDANAQGLSIERTSMVDSRNAAKITLNNVNVPAEALLGAQDEGYAALSKVLDIANVCLSAELLGIISEAFERTVNYLKERKQFGIPIGAFQGLQHRAADMFCEIELCQSVVFKALIAIDTDSKDLPLLASLAKAKTSEIATLVTNEGIQMFGGIGMTDDEEIGFFIKRARVLQRTFGGHSYHADRFASLKGF